MACLSPCAVCGSMVDCSQFLEGYSAFRDGELEDRVRDAFEVHRLTCEKCARYDRVIDAGVRLYQRASRLEISEEFLPRLQHRIFHVDEEMRGARTASGVSATLTLAIAAMIVVAAWVPATRPRPTVVELPPIAARAPLAGPAPVVEFSEIPFFRADAPTFPGWSSSFPVAGSHDLFFRSWPLGAEYSLQSVIGR